MVCNIPAARSSPDFNRLEERSGIGGFLDSGSGEECNSARIERLLKCYRRFGCGLRIA